MTTQLSSHDAGLACKNCGAATSGNFCQQCGQTTHLHVPSAREFLHEFVTHYVALEGKLWKTLARLIARPGFLTRAYIDGRRARYLEPLRLYLTLSIIFFAVFKLTGVDMLQLSDPSPELAAAIAEGRAKDTLFGPALPEHAAQYERVLATLEERTSTTHPYVHDKITRFNDLSPQNQRAAFRLAFFSYTPYAIFAMMPVFALFLKILYLGSGRRYGEHFLFGLHTNAFAFLVLSVMILLPASWNIVTFVLLLWLVLYLPLAMRRVYGSGWFTTILRWAILIFAHVTAIMSAVMTVMGQVVLA